MKPSRRLFKASIPSVGDLLTDITPDVKLNIGIAKAEKEWLIEVGNAIAKKVEETSDKVDYRWKVTQWLIGVGMVMNAVSFFIGRAL